MKASHADHIRSVKVIMAFLMFIIVCLLMVFIVWAVLRPAHAIDNGQWGHDPGTSQWFKSLRSPQGFPCCDYADGTRIEDPDYRERMSTRKRSSPAPTRSVTRSCGGRMPHRCRTASCQAQGDNHDDRTSARRQCPLRPL